MADGTIDFGVVERVQADAVGVPGQRRFRLQARTATDYAQLWIEREQAQAIGLALEQLLAQVQAQRNEPAVVADAGGPLDDFPPTATVEFTVGRLGLGYDDDRDLVVLQLTNIETAVENDEGMLPSEPAAVENDEGVLPSEPAAVEALVMRFTRPQAAALREQCETTLAAGRPRCPLCGAPMGTEGEHMCIRANGHAKGVLEGGSQA